VNVQNYTINATGGTNTINATATGTAITPATNFNSTASTAIANNAGVDIKRKFPEVPVKEVLVSINPPHSPKPPR